MNNAALAYGIVAVAMSFVCFVAYGLDKRQAALGGRRVPERRLHLLAFLGGWPGALIGQRVFRHKTRKATFLVASWLTIVLHLALLAVASLLLRSS